MSEYRLEKGEYKSWVIKRRYTNKKTGVVTWKDWKFPGNISQAIRAIVEVNVPTGFYAENAEELERAYQKAMLGVGEQIEYLFKKIEMLENKINELELAEGEL